MSVHSSSSRFENWRNLSGHTFAFDINTEDWHPEKNVATKFKRYTIIRILFEKGCDVINSCVCHAFLFLCRFYRPLWPKRLFQIVAKVIIHVERARFYMILEPIAKEFAFLNALHSTGAYKNGLTPTRRCKRTRLGIYISRGSNAEKYVYLSPLYSMKDAIQGLGYDVICEQDGLLAEAFWDQNHLRQVDHPHSALCIKKWLQEHKKGDSLPKLRVLDIACGTCTATYRLFRLLPKLCGIDQEVIELYGLDLNSDILSVGMRRCCHHRLNVNLCIGDAQVLPYRDNYFDIVINFGGIDQLNDPQMGLHEMLRVMRPGGLGLVRDECGDLFETWPCHVKKRWPELKDGLPPHFSKEHLPEVDHLQLAMLNDFNYLLSWTKGERK